MPATNTLTSIFTAIANAIRGKNGSSDTYTPDEMAAAIAAIPSGGGSFDASQLKSVAMESTKLAYDFTGFDTSLVTKFNSFIAYNYNLRTLDLSMLDTSSATDMNSFLAGCRYLTSVDVSSLDVSHVTNMSYMFYSCAALTSLDLANFDTASVTNLQALFMSCTALESVNIPGIDTTHITTASNMANMFRACNALRCVIWSQKSVVQPLLQSPVGDQWVTDNAIFYVPDNLVTAYQAATNWSTISSRIKGISELPQQYKTLYNIS